jgi:magnesium transporter
MSTEAPPREKQRRVRRRKSAPGAPPGTLLPDPSAPRPPMRVLAYGPAGFAEQEIFSADEVASFLGLWPVVWLNVDGVGDVETIRKIGELFGLHPLALEDVVNVHQRPKVEPYEKHLFIVMQMLLAGEKVDAEQLGLFLGSNFVLTFQEWPGDCFDPVRERIRKNHGRLRAAGPDYLAYSLLDAVVDFYFPVLEGYGERLETIEQQVVTEPRRETLAGIHDIKRNLLTMRRAAWPMREALNSLLREDTPFIAQETRTYLRDCYDHSVRIIDILETDRETAFSLLETYLSSLSNRMNEIMKVLTIIATHLHPADLHRRHLWHEFRQHAGAAFPLGLSRHHGAYGRDCRRHAALFPPPWLARLAYSLPCRARLVVLTLLRPNC